jgi:hypothetical protein
MFEPEHDLSFNMVLNTGAYSKIMSYDFLATFWEPGTEDVRAYFERLLGFKMRKLLNCFASLYIDDKFNTYCFQRSFSDDLINVLSFSQVGFSSDPYLSLYTLLGIFPNKASMMVAVNQTVGNYSH